MNIKLTKNNIRSIGVHLESGFGNNWDDRAACRRAIMAELCGVVKKWTRAEVDAIATKHSDSFYCVNAVSIGLISE